MKLKNCLIMHFLSFLSFNAIIDQTAFAIDRKDLHKGNLEIGKDLSVRGNSDNKKDVLVRKNLTVYGNTRVNKNLQIDKDMLVKGSGEYKKNLQIRKDMHVDGNAAYQKNMQIGKDLTVGGLFSGKTASIQHFSNKFTPSGHSYISMTDRHNSICFLTGIQGQGNFQNASIRIVDGQDFHHQKGCTSGKWCLYNQNDGNSLTVEAMCLVGIGSRTHIDMPKSIN